MRNNLARQILQNTSIWTRLKISLYGYLKILNYKN